MIRALIVKDILDEQSAKQLAYRAIRNTAPTED